MTDEVGVLMAAWKDQWPLARRWAFVKPRLLRMPQKSHVMEVDFCPLARHLRSQCLGVAQAEPGCVFGSVKTEVE